MSVSFHFEWGGSDTLTVDEIWPDGNAPENPTVEDVIAEVGKAGRLRRLARDWNLDFQHLYINGRDSRLR